jgi:hypothetical protein
VTLKILSEEMLFMPITHKVFEGYHALTVACSMVGRLVVLFRLLVALSNPRHIDRPDRNGLTALGAALLANRADIALTLVLVRSHPRLPDCSDVLL